MNFSKFLIFLGILLIVLSGYLVYQRYSPKKLEFKNFSASANTSSEINPVSISIPSLGIKNVIIPSMIKDNKWEATTEGISYLSSSPVPGQDGNSILYGHNWPNILGDLSKIKPGEKIEITMSNGERRIFTVEYTSIVNSSQTHILNQSTDKRITIYTCAGFLDSKRFVATAILTK